MICYRDMTFCTFWEDCTSSPQCSRPLTPDVQVSADKWWEEWKVDRKTPICTFVDQPSCHVSEAQAVRGLEAVRAREK